jgi:hypothetical protein
MAAQPRSRADVARRLADRLGIEFHPDLLEIVPPVGWDQFPTRAELGEAFRSRDEHLERRLRAVRDALDAAHHDEARRLIGRTFALVGSLALSAILVRARRGRSSVTGRVCDQGGNRAGHRTALHRRRVG